MGVRPKNIGGQAVIEGVMMRGPAHLATAVRQPDGGITIDRQPLKTAGDRWPLLKKPLVRGVVALVESLVYGMKALSFSAQVAGDEEEELTDKEIALTMGGAFLIAILLFIVLPTYSAKFLKLWIADPFWLNLAEGVIRITVFLGYVGAISMVSDIRRVFQYHGAEHKTIHAYEAGQDLTVENVRPHSTLHPRCGTNFLFLVMLISIVVFAFLGWPDLWLRIASRVVLMPFVAGLAYEAIRYAGRHIDQPLVYALTLPGLWLQKITTREPDDSQIEVAIRALQAVLPEPEGIPACGFVAEAGLEVLKEDADARQTESD